MTQNPLIKNIDQVFKNLKTMEILNFLNQPQLDKVKLLDLVIESKVGFNAMMNISECERILEAFDEKSIYTAPEYSNLIIYITSMGNDPENDITLINKLHNFHKILFKTGNLLKTLSHSSSVDSEKKGLNLVKNNTLVDNPLINEKEIETAIKNEELTVDQKLAIPVIPTIPKLKPFKIYSQNEEEVIEKSEAAKLENDTEINLRSFLKSLSIA